MTQPVDSLVQQWAVTPTVRAAGPRLLSVQVAYATVPVALVETGPGELELRAHWVAPPQLAADSNALAALATHTTFARAGQLRCLATDAAIDVAYPIYLEGLTRNKFYDAATEVAKAAVSIDESARAAQPAHRAAPEAASAGAAPVPIDEPDAVPDALPDALPDAVPNAAADRVPDAAPEPIAEPAAAMTTATPVVPQPVMYTPPEPSARAEQPPTEQLPIEELHADQPHAEQPRVQQPHAVQPQTEQPHAEQPHAVQPQTEQRPEPQQGSPAADFVPPQQHTQWTPTHTVPPGGVPAWAAPDPMQPPVTHLPPGLAVRLVERQGGWARIEADNGWTGWVDGRPLPDPPRS